MIAFASSLDQAGPLARSGRGLRAAAVGDERLRRARRDQRAAPAAGLPRRRCCSRATAPAPRGRCRACASACRRSSSRPALAADVDGAVRAALAELETLGATLVDVSLPRTELSIPVYYIIAPAEASSNLSPLRRRALRPPRGEVRPTCWTCTRRRRAEGFGAEVKRRIMIGTYVLSHGYYDAYYLQAQKLRRMIADDFQACFRRVRPDRRPGGAHAWPGSSASRATTRWQAYLADIFTLPASLAGLPGMSVPAGFGEARHAGGPAADRQLLRRRRAAARRACASSRRPTGTGARRQALSTP